MRRAGCCADGSSPSADVATTPRVAIVNQTLVAKYFPGEDPIGKRYGNTAPGARARSRQIVGVVADIKEGTLDSEIWPAEYYPVRPEIPAASSR